MPGKKRRSDTPIEVARYRLEKLLPTDGEENEPDTAGQTTMDERVHFVEISIQQAMRRGDFDDLPGAGKPIRDLGGVHDPDWWIRQKIEREKITGLGPPALTLRTENEALPALLDTMMVESRVRDTLAEFNTRVIEARRQLLGGPPVVTPLRDVEVEVALWRERQQQHRAEAAAARALEESRLGSLTRRQRREQRRRQ
jgi:hypothetical protein